VNATAVYKTGPYEFGLFGTNLTNGAKISDVTTNTIAIQPGDNLYMIRPRTVGVRVKALLMKAGPRQRTRATRSAPTGLTA
jgi:hypothetical protein